jgi:hypothetical protein
VGIGACCVVGGNRITTVGAKAVIQTATRCVVLGDDAILMPTRNIRFAGLNTAVTYADFVSLDR